MSLHRVRYFPVSLALGCALLGAPLSCGLVDAMQKSVYLKRTARLNSYSGILSERYGDFQLKREIKFRAPDQFRSTILSKGAYAGITTSYDGRRLVQYFPATNFAIVFKNLTLRIDPRQWLSDSFDYHKKHYEVSLGGNGKIAEHKTRKYIYKPRASSPRFFASNAHVLEEFYLPLGLDVFRKEKLAYSFWFERIRLNSVPDDEELSPPLPARANRAVYDMGAEGLTPARLRALANFQVVLPDESLGNFSLKQIIRSSSFVPAFTLRYEKPNYYLFISMVKEYGISLTPRPFGMKIDDKITLNFQGVWTALYFRHRGVNYAMTGNVPYPDLLAVAREMSR